MRQDVDDRPVLTAAQVVEWKKNRGLLPRGFAPRSVLLCFQSPAVNYARQRNRARRVGGLPGEVHLLDRPGPGVAIARSPGPGAPAAVALLEELAALGAERFISVGLAGALQPALGPGDLVIPERAIRDEGTSQHYLPGAKWATADAELVKALLETLNAAGQPARIGCTWTTDAPYREMRQQVEAYRLEGIDTVEMEAAAVFAAGQCLNVRVAAALVIADALGGVRAPLDFDTPRVESGLRNLVAAALRVLGEVE